MTSEHNPFSTRFTRPGALPYLLADSDSWDAVIGRLRSTRWWGQIVGPHGTGKSTLLHALVPLLKSEGRTIIWYRLLPGQRALPDSPAAGSDSPVDRYKPDTQVIVDGYEQLSWWARWRLRRRCRMAGAGLLVTAHRSIGLPTLIESHSSPAMLARLVDLLIPDASQVPDRHEWIQEAWRHRQGNIREALFELYDRFEQQNS